MIKTVRETDIERGRERQMERASPNFIILFLKQPFCSVTTNLMSGNGSPNHHGKGGHGHGRPDKFLDGKKQVCNTYLKFGRYDMALKNRISSSILFAFRQWIQAQIACHGCLMKLFGSINETLIESYTGCAPKFVILILWVFH